MGASFKPGANSVCASPIIKRYLPIVLLCTLVYVVAKGWIGSWPRNPVFVPRIPSASDQNHTPVDSSSKLDSELEYDFPPFVRLYKSGRVERLIGTIVVPSSAIPIPGVVSKDVIINEKTGLAVRLYMPDFTNGTASEQKLPILIYIHGGAFVIESAFSPVYHKYLKTVALKGNILIVSVDYRLAPEHPLPIAYDDSIEAVKWVIANAKSGPEKYLSEHGDLSRILLAGDSAGGNIAHNTVMQAGKEGLDDGVRIKGLILMNPYFWGKEPVGKENRDAGLRWRMESTWGFVCAGKYEIDHPYVNPLSLQDEWRKLGCDRVLMTVSELDLFRERGVAYVDGLTKSDWAGTVEMYETMGEDHVYYLSKPDSDKSWKEMEHVISFINRP
ncbi:alpha/beta-Hydrolases superfamily protein [Rhynchospora pubera]|uniref:Alpha/beta-Hydrolases superfamily protein n=1 Tax=Rhynchospora pubera TaxID=906938 RepID=A0AAV8CD41_9POAL|nr:alpha/beta-Hydrolases superfamily protein [Rhynchospora pubera]